MITGVCGDASNDYEAISTSDVGISLSTGAIAPFYLPSLSGLVPLLCEGRGVLANSLSVVKFILLCSVIQTIQITVAYFIWDQTDVLPALFPVLLISDVFLCLPISLSLVCAKIAVPRLAPTKPPTRILGFGTMSSVAMLLVLSVVGLFVPLLLHAAGPRDTILPDFNQILTIMFFTGALLYISLGITVSLGFEWREPVYLRAGLFATCTCGLFGVLFLMFMPLSWDVAGFWSWSKMVDIGTPTKIAILVVSAVTFALCMICEALIFKARSWLLK